MSERLPNTSSAHAMQHNRVIFPALRTGIWKHRGMFSAAHMAVSGLTLVVVSGSLGPKLPFAPLKPGTCRGDTLQVQTSAPSLTLSPHVCPPSVGKIVGISVLPLVITTFMQ